MKINRSFRINLGFVLVILLVLFNAISSIKKTGIIPPGNIGINNLSYYLNRFDDIKDTVRCHDTVGYFGDHKRGEYFQAQYTFAPALLIGEIEHPLVVINYKDEKPDSINQLENEMQLLLDLNNGVKLYQGVGD